LDVDAVLGELEKDDKKPLLKNRPCPRPAPSPPSRYRSVGYVDFPDEASAMTARNFYSGWKLAGQNGPGLSLEVRTRPAIHPKPKLREKKP
jgi:hypothetical protein